MEVVVIIILIVGFILWYSSQKKNKSEKNSGHEATTVQPDETTSEMVSHGEKVVESLLQTEEYIVVNDGSDGTVYTSSEAFLTLLYDVIPKINDEFATTRVAFELNEMANTLFPNKVKTYLALDAQARKERFESWKADLAKMQQYAQEAAEIIAKANLSKDERESMLIAIKY